MTQPSDLTSAEINQLHRKSDRDSSKDAQHHTIGILPYQAASGAHTHDGRDSKILDEVSVAPHSHQASSIESIPSGGLIATDVQNALAELEAEIAGLTAEDIDSSAVGGLAATNIQSALAELDTEKSPTGHTHATLVTPTNVTGSRADPEDALKNLLTALAGKGIITDSTVA